jgi:hypothetical protein
VYSQQKGVKSVLPVCVAFPVRCGNGGDEVYKAILLRIIDSRILNDIFLTVKRLPVVRD